jgi:outer membrane protein OmpA-like peptidoglycan-associated protein
MKFHRLALIAGLGAAFALPTSAQTPTKDGWVVIPDAKCAEIEFADSTLEQFPEVAQACRGVVRNAQGRAFVQIGAKVHYLRLDPRSRQPRNVTLDMLAADDTVLRKISVRPPRGFRFTVDGETYSGEYLSPGTDLTLYLPTDRWELVWNPGNATPIDTKVFIEDIESFLVSTTLEADEAFAFDKAELSDKGRADLDAILAAGGDYVPSISIIGYTDSIGDEDYNLGLSQRRANAAKQYLVSQGVPAERISALGRGEANPIVKCPGKIGEALKECLAPNRRAEIAFLVPAVADLADVTVTRTYVDPLGETVTVTEQLNVAQMADASEIATKMADACATEIESFCSNVEPGNGRVLGCLTGHRQEYYGYSDQCDDAIDSLVDMFTGSRARMNLVGEVCSAELAACESAPLGDKLECVRRNEKSEECASALSQLTRASF